MRLRILSFVLLAVLCGGVTASAGNVYKLENVKRVDQDLYSVGGNTYMQTQNCYHYTYGEDAVYKEDTKTVIWNDNSTCTVKGFIHK
jgi:hypothetical protein